MNIKIPKKFTDKELDEYINRIYANHRAKPSDTYLFDFTGVEYIGNQELLILSALFKSFYQANIEFKLRFLQEGISTKDVSERVKRQIIQFWEVWRIWQIVPPSDYLKYFNLAGNTIDILKKEINYFPKMSELYSRHGVTPFISLDYINNYNEIEVQKAIAPIYKLNSVIESLLKMGNCYHPFTSNSLSTIITEEFFLNFLDHSQNSSFSGFKPTAFMSISYQDKIDETKISPSDIQKRKALNFNTECLPETVDFFLNRKSGQYKNFSYIQFSFLDFGQGIAETLKKEHLKEFPRTDLLNNDTEVLIHAFRHDSSRHPIFDSSAKIEKTIPRGLFDALSIVRRYKGLMVVRSNYGKIIYDFSQETSPSKALKTFGDDTTYFPGSLISIYIPAIQDSDQINISAIKPDVIFSKIKPDNKRYISIKSIVDSLPASKNELYGSLLVQLQKIISHGKDNSLTLVSFLGCEQIEKRIIKKVLYFLMSNYEINNKSNVIVVNQPPTELLTEIESELLFLSDAIRNYKLHPLPIVSFNSSSEEIDIKWLGVFDREDEALLNKLLQEGYTVRRDELNFPSNVTGQLSDFDKLGNLHSNLPTNNELVEYFKGERDLLNSLEMERLIKKHHCIKKDDHKNLYLCNGNYYQKEYIQLNNLINDQKDCNIISQLLFDKIGTVLPANVNDYKFIAITSTGQKLVKSFEFQGFIQVDNYITLDSYHGFHNDLTEENISIGDKFILLCDVTSTGVLTRRLEEKLSEFGATVEFVAVIVSILDKGFSPTASILESLERKIICLHKYPITKYSRSDVSTELDTRQVIRINPHTNIPITLSITETKYEESVIFPTTITYVRASNEIKIINPFLETISPDSINVGFYKFNNAIHPYFFNTESILPEIGESLLAQIFAKINNPKLNTDSVRIFYPRRSSVEHFRFDRIKKILNNHAIEELEIERFGTTEGWRFPHNSDYLSSKVDNNVCFIIDDGSCSGDSLVQMVDEICFYSAKEIIMLSFIGRVHDHKREFFSRVTHIKAKNGLSIPISIFFASHWHIPTYYLDENPNVRESYWLKEICSIQNIPSAIKRIALNILDEIQPKSKDEFKDHKYLPKDRVTGKIPKKDLLLVREEVGKVVGYRLYKESFVFFDIFMRKYETRMSTTNRYKEIELLCATLIFEPSLYNKIAGVLPDVVMKIEEFVRKLIFEDDRLFDNLFYKWSKKDIVHLFFIVFKDDKLVRELTIGRFKQLLDFTRQTLSTTNYILYKLLKYIPLVQEELNFRKYDLPLRDLINRLRDETTVPTKEIKKYYNFLNSLPSRDDFRSQLSVLQERYKKETEKEYHDERKSFGHNVSEFIVTTREIIENKKVGRVFAQPSIQIIRNSWVKILSFLNPILTFSSSYKEFFLPYTYFELSIKLNELRELVGLIEDTIYSQDEVFEDEVRLEAIMRGMMKIQADFDLNTTFHQLIDKESSSLSRFVEGLATNFKGIKPEVFNIEKVRDTDIISIPQLYCEKLLIVELTTNMKKYFDVSASSRFVMTGNYAGNDTYEITLTNTILPREQKGSNGEGLKCINLLNDAEYFGFEYKSETIQNEFIQKIKLTINAN